ncbi:hypothetical protein J6590_005307 [Homalodisca vitripennis]|nr:hypothetical protein J6590_005307 [Homalodisca vitripennis]
MSARIPLAARPKQDNNCSVFSQTVAAATVKYPATSDAGLGLTMDSQMYRVVLILTLTVYQSCKVIQFTNDWTDAGLGLTTDSQLYRVVLILTLTV